MAENRIHFLCGSVCSPWISFSFDTFHRTNVLDFDIREYILLSIFEASLYKLNEDLILKPLSPR